MDYEELAEEIEELLNDSIHPISASADHRGGYSRIFISRMLSKGKQQMGYIEVEDGKKK